ncbi:F-box protein: endocytic membrane traffic, recycling ReCYcling 1 [Myotisia sp. PD_48]|nr:F-box protein: endocytic membrane traffic, recycling ReCYcling 1 [Myotisia sp. PD_48]
MSTPSSRQSSRAPTRVPRKDILAPLKLAQIEILKPSLPAEIFAYILDYLPPTDLIRVARTSRRMLEMVYDDTIWVRLLKTMECWNDAEARNLAEPISGQRVRHSLNTNIIPTQSGLSVDKSRTVSDSSGFDVVEINGAPRADTEPATRRKIDPLSALKSVRSVRGKAREEYGKVHSALNSFYIDLVDSAEPGQSLAFKTYDQPEQQALLLAQLQRFGKIDMSISCEKNLQTVFDVVSNFEIAALGEFRNAYETGDVEALMQRYAQTLTNLNGGQAAVEFFIHHNHIITRKSDFGKPMDYINKDTGTTSLEHTHAFLVQLGVAVNEEISIINKCFSSKPDIFSSFIEKVGKDVLSPYFLPLFDELHSTNTNSYIQTVSGTFAQLLNFIRGLQPIQISSTIFSEAAHQALELIYEPHMDLYLAEELSQFRNQADAIVVEWDRQLSEQAASTESYFMSNVNRQADKKDFLTSFKKVIMAPVNLFPSFSKTSEANTDQLEKDVSSLQLQNAHRSNRSSLISPLAVVPTPIELPTTELAAKAAIMNSKFEGIRSLFSIEVALNLVHSAKASLDRMAQFVKLGGDLKLVAQKQCEAIFVALLDILGNRHVIAGFDRAVDHLSEYRPHRQGTPEKSDVEPLVTFLELVNVGDLILQMMDVFYEQELVGNRLTDRSDFLDPAVKEKKRFEQKLDERVAAGLNKGIDVLMEETEYLLATKQTAADYNPESVGTSQEPVDVGPSDVAKLVVQVISAHTGMLVGSTDKGTLDVFNQEIGLRLFAALCKHLKRQRISVDGSIKLISDMNHYFSLIQPMKNDQLLLYFTALRELSQVYLIHPSDSKEMATIIADTRRFHGIFRAEEVYEFAERRADWYQVKKSVERAMFGFGCLVM